MFLFSAGSNIVEDSGAGKDGCTLMKLVSLTGRRRRRRRAENNRYL
jgi:hypothetical protein